MRVRVAQGPNDPRMAQWWRHARDSGAMRGIADPLDRLLDDPYGVGDVEVSQRDGIAFYQAMLRVPGGPDDPYVQTAFAFEDD